MTKNLRSQLRYVFGSLKLRLAVASVVLIGASVTLTVFFVMRDMEQRSQRAALDTELADAERLAGVLSSRLISLQTSIRSASTRLPADDLANIPALIAFLDDQIVLRSLFESVFIATPSGRLLVAADEKGIRESRVNAADRPYFRRTLEERRPVISEPVISRASGEPTIVLTMPAESRYGAVRAIIGCVIRLTTHSLVSDLTRSGGDDGDPVTTIITDATGHIIAHPDPNWILKDAQTEPRFAAAIEYWESQGRPVDTQGSARRFGDYVVAVAGVPDADWLIFRSAPAEVLLGGPIAGRRQGMWIGTVVAVTGGLIILLTTLMMLRPLRQLERRALRLLGNEMAVEDGWPSGHGELGALANVFQHVMKERAAIQKSGDELFEKMRAVMGNAPVGIAFTRLSHFELVSAQFGRMFGYEGEEMVGRPTQVICLSEGEHRSLGVRVAAAFSAGQMFDEEMELVRADGTHFWARRQGAPVRTGEISSGTIWIFTDITESRIQREELSWTAAHDALTGLLNRREFEVRLAEQLQERRTSEAASALFIDLDQFKAVNDSAGHAAGDELLRNVGAILTGRARAQDSVARLGGDEFAILLRGCDRLAAERVADQICLRVQQYRLQWQGLSLSVGASIGVVEIEQALADVEAVMSAADAACYAAKRAGRNAVRTHRSTTLRSVGAMSQNLLNR
jgi:diguanylate cyclase (GGDEF)-like protein/PAS domain S-box-containing protein